MSAKDTEVVRRIQSLQQAHNQRIEQLEQQAYRRDEAHSNEIAKLTVQLDERGAQIESLSNLICRLLDIVNASRTTTQDGNAASVNCVQASIDGLTAQVKDLKSQCTVMNMAMSQAMENGIPKHNEAFEAQEKENIELHLEVVDLHKQILDSTRKALEASDEVESQVQTLSDRTRAMERKLEGEIGELQDFVDSHRVMLEDMTVEVKDVKQRTEDCSADNKAMLNIAIRADHKIKQVENEHDERYKDIQALKNKANSLAANLRNLKHETQQENRTVSAQSIVSPQPLPKRPNFDSHARNSSFDQQSTQAYYAPPPFYVSPSVCYGPHPPRY